MTMASNDNEKGLNLWMAVILLSGQMAGMGVLNLPNSMIGTGCQS